MGTISHHEGKVVDAAGLTGVCETNLTVNRQPLRRNEAIDALRGSAIVAVIFVHTAYAWPVLGRTFIQFASLSRYGVDVFFVLSGWALTNLYFSIPEQNRPSVGARVRNRLVRLAPLYWLGVIGYGLLGSWWGWEARGTAGEALANLLFLNGWSEERASVVVPGGWSISVEFWAGVAFLALLPWLRGVRLTMACWAGLMVVSRLWPLGGESDTPWMHLPSFLLGALAWRIQASDRGWRWLRRFAWVLPMAAVATLGTLHHGGLGLLDRQVQAGGAGFLLVLWAGAASGDSTVTRWMAWLGTLSYGLYLVHFVMIELAVWTTVSLLPIGAPGWVCGAMSFTLALAFSVPAAWCLDRKLDRPLRSWVTRRTTRRSASRGGRHGPGGV